MKRQQCPHCGEFGFYCGEMPPGAVAVIQCHLCGELAVLFRGTMIALKKEVLESGTFDQRKEHLAEVVAQFLESGLFDFGGDGGGSFLLAKEDDDVSDRPRPVARRRKRTPRPISEQELERFVRVDLKCIDNPVYFKRIFG